MDYGQPHLVVPRQALAEVGLWRPVFQLEHGGLLVVLLVVLEEAVLLHVARLPGVAVDHLDTSTASLKLEPVKGQQLYWTTGTACLELDLSEGSELPGHRHSLSQAETVKRHWLYDTMQ